MTTARCACGGEVAPDYFDPIARPVEHFMRCVVCGKPGPSYATPEEAAAQWARDSVGIEAAA